MRAHEKKWYKGHFSVLYVIIKVDPPHTWTCPLHINPTNIETLPLPSYAQSTSPLSLGLGPLIWWTSSSPPPPPSSAYVYKEISGSVSGQEEVFVSLNSSESSAGCRIQYVGTFKINLVVQGFNGGKIQYMVTSHYFCRSSHFVALCFIPLF